MSSDGDLLAFQGTMNDNLAEANTVLFNDKSWAFVTDSTSNSGSFSSGQCQFDLTTLNSQSQLVSLAEAVIEFPIKISAKVLTAGTGTETAKSIAAINSAIIKNGWHQWIDSAQLIINGQTIQSAQPWENVAAQFRILSTWSQDELVKNGPSCGFALDDCTGDAIVQTTTSIATGMGNATFATPLVNAVKGLDVVGNQTILFNKGVASRATYTNYDINPASANMQTTILGAAAMKQAGRSHAASLSGGSNTVGTVIYSACYMATVRLKDICDIKDFPLTRNLKGFLYLSFNNAQVNLTGSNTTLSAMSITPLNGRTTPFLINNATTVGLTMGQYGTTSPVVQVTGVVDATQVTDLVASSGCAPLLTNARLLVPYYKANPKADSALSQSSKFFTTLEKLTVPFTIPKNGAINYTMSTGVPNPRRLTILPLWKNLGGTLNLDNPESSPFDSSPATSGPFATLGNFQVYLANTPLYQTAIQYDYEQYVQEQAQLGLNGNVMNESTSGLLTQQLWEQNHRFYTVDLARRMDSEDGSSKSVQISATNPSTNYDLKCIGTVWYEKRWVMNTNTGMLSPV